MAVQIRNTIVQALLKPSATLQLRSSAAQVMVKPAATLQLRSVAAQVMVAFESFVQIRSTSIQVLFRAEPDKINGGYLNPAYWDEPPEEPDMVFTDIIFPECISYGSTGVPRYITDKAEVLSGSEQREARGLYARHEYSIVMENLDQAELADVMNIWHVVSGDFAAFLFLDPFDHTSLNTPTNFSGTDVTPFDQVVGTAVGSVTSYSLFKYYVKESRIKERRIKYPKDGTIRVAVGGVETTAFTYDYATTQLVFTAAYGLSVTATRVGDQLTTTLDQFAPVAVGDLVFIDGLTNAAGNKTSGNPLRVRSKTSDNVITLENFDTTDWTAGADEVDASIVLTQTTPPTGASITAGFYFYVPVRFDDGDNATVEIVAGLRESAVGTYGDIKLKEVFD